MQILQFIQDLLKHLPDIIVAIVAVLMTTSVVCTALAALFKVVGWQRGVDAMAALGADFVKFANVLKGQQIKNDTLLGPQTQKSTTINPPKLGPVAVLLLAGLAGLTQTSCTNFQPKINAVLEAESKMSAQEKTLLQMAELQILMFPPEQQSQARKIIVDADAAFTAALVAKGNTLQAINDGLSSDWTKLGMDIAAAASAIEQLASILIHFGANAVEVQRLVGEVKSTQVYTVSRITQ